MQAVAEAALGRAAREVVLHAVAVEDAERAVVHLDGEVHGKLALAGAQHLAHALVEVQALGRGVELGERRRENVGDGAAAFRAAV